MIKDIIPKSPVDRLRRGDFGKKEQQREFDADIVSSVLGMSRAFMARALDRPHSRPKTFTLAEVLSLLDVDGFQETFIPRSQIPRYLLEDSGKPPSEIPALRRSSTQVGDVTLKTGNARDLLSQLDAKSVQCVVTSTPYWGMRVYDNERDIRWADGESCPYGFEQTPEGFIRHTIELLMLLKPAMTQDGSVWWNIMDTYNTRTPIRQNSRQRLDAMGEKPGSRKGWTEHDACRHSAGHMYLDDTELSSIPFRIAERASRIGYKLKSVITWYKDSSTPDSAKNRVSRQAEYILHLSVDKTPFFNKKAWQALEPRLGGPDRDFESAEKIADVWRMPDDEGFAPTDIWRMPTSTGKNDHGAEFPLALPGRCIALTSREGDLVLDPFMGSGTTALAAAHLRRRCLGFDISDKYTEIAVKRLRSAVLADPLFDVNGTSSPSEVDAGTAEIHDLNAESGPRSALEPDDKAACWAGRGRSPPQRGGSGRPVSYRASRLVMMKTVAHQTMAS